MIKCGRCGNANADGVFFCQFCGGRLSGGDPSAEPAVPPSAPPQPSVVFDAGFRLVVVHRDGTDGASYTLIGDQVDIGRAGADLTFDDPHLAARHARIVTTVSGRALVPVDTRNGVYVRLKGPADLADGDYVLLGKQVLRFELVPEVERSLRPAIEHGVVLFGTPVKPAWARLRQAVPAGITRDMFHLTRNEVVIGRENGDIVFSDDEFMSRRHAQLSLRYGRAHLEDLGSSNGTFIRIRGPYNLSNGDLIRMGDELLRFEIG